MDIKFFKNLGRLEPFEIKNSSTILILGAPSTFAYFEVMQYYNSGLNIPFYGNFIFAALFLIVGILPFLKNKKILLQYGWYVFFAIFGFQHYLTYSTSINNFSLDFLLVTYVFIFGSVLVLSNRILVLIFSGTQFLHLGYQVLRSDLDSMSMNAILLSIGVVFIFSFLVMNGLIRYRKKLQALNFSLESTVRQRTRAIEARTKQLMERNKDLEEFAYVVSHDLKTPLRNIYTLTHWLTDDEEYNFNKETLQSLGLIKEQVTQMDLLVDGVLNYSLQMDRERQITFVDTNELMRRLIVIHTNETCNIQVLQQLPMVSFNESQLMQVFQNLIQNAVKHNDKSIAEIKIGYQMIGNFHEFSIKDNGPGIAEKYHEKIFQLFQKLEFKTDIDAIGIGLALVKKIIERNNGTIRLESREGNGTTFFFTIPK